MNYDVIGDIHGHASALEALLARLGYREHLGAWRHPDRMALFLGDFIDRGPEQLETVGIVRRMVDAGTALATMGNHELNAIAWYLPDPEKPGEFLRPHRSCSDKNRKQHEAFLAAVEGRPELHAEIVEWFLTLPLWLDLPELRAVHACWHQRFIDYVADMLLPGNRLSAELMLPVTREPADEAEKDTPEPSVFKAIDALIKGLEMPLPSGFTFRDKEDKERNRARVRWWDGGAVTYRTASMLPEKDRSAAPDMPIPGHVRIGYSEEKPVFFGHYWMTGTPRPSASRAACLDYSVADGGVLCAYRHDGEPVLQAERFCWVGSAEN